MHGRLEQAKDILIIVATGGTLLVGVGRLTATVDRVPDHERRIKRLERKMDFVVEGVGKLTRTQYRAPHEAEGSTPGGD